MKLKGTILRSDLEGGLWTLKTDGGDSYQLTGALDGINHRVSETEYSATAASGSRLYKTLCGRTVLGAALATPPKAECAGCARAMHELRKN